MAITAADIQNQSFSIDRKGYDVDEVDVFLEHVANEIDALNQQVADLQAALADAQMAGFDEPAQIDEVDDADLGETQAFTPTYVEEELASEEPEPEPEAEPAQPQPAVTADVARLKAKIADLEKQLAEKSANDSAISQALIVAQRSADDVVAKAKAEANRIVKDADNESDRILAKAEADRKKVQDSIRALEDEREGVRADYRDMLNDFMDDAERKLAAIDADYRNNKHAVHSNNAAAPAAEPVNDAVANYQVPTNITIPGSQNAAAPAVQQSFVEKDLSGYGDVDDEFDFDDPE